MHDKVLEEVAKIVYESWKGDPKWLPWEPNGNSLKQDAARGVAARILRIRDLYANASKENEPSKYPPSTFAIDNLPRPFTIGDTSIHYFSPTPNNEDVCFYCSKPKGWHTNNICPSNIMLCSSE